MTETTEKERIERRLANAELNFERRFRDLQEAYEGRLAAVESELQLSNTKLNAMSEKLNVMGEDLLKAVAENFRLLNEADEDQCDALDTIVFDMTYMKDRLDAVFDKIFPDHPRYAAAILDIIDKNWRNDQ